MNTYISSPQAVAMDLPFSATEAPISVLVVEDSASLLRLYTHILSQAGYRVIEATSGRAALQTVWEQRPDIVLLDRVLPDMDGGDICRHIKRQLSSSACYVVMLSALKTSEDDRVSGLEAGADDYIVKPVGRRELLARIQVAARLRRTQAALQSSEAMFRTLAENSPDMITRFDRDMRFLYVNRTVQRIIGEPPESFIGKHISESPLPHALSERLQRSLAQVFAEGEAMRIEFELASGEDTLIFDTHLVPEYDMDGAIHSILSLSRDFTEHVRAEQQIARLATVVEQAIECVLITDPQGRIVYVNGAYETMTGYRADELRGQYVPELRSVYPADFCNQYRTVLTTGAPWAGSTRCRCRSGSLCEIEVSIFPIRDRLGAVIDYAVLQRDITPRRNVEREREALLSVAASLRSAGTRAEMLPIILDQIMSALNLTGALFLSADAETGEVTIDLAVGEHAYMTGRRLTPEQATSPYVMGHSSIYVNNSVAEGDNEYLTRFLGPVSAVAAVPLFAQQRCVGVLWVGRAESITDRVLGILLAICDMAANAIHRADLYGEIQRYAAELELRVAERTRELADANERLLELDRLKSKFVSNVSHELRTPISNLKLYMLLLRRGKGDRRAQYESMLQTSVERLGQLVDDILNLSRIEIAQVHGRTLEPTDLNAVANQIVALHQPEADASGLALVFEPDPAIPLVNGDYNQLSQLITNLVANALHYTHAGSVRLRTERLNVGKLVRLVVEDTGIGILPEDLPHLFDRFYRGNHRQPEDIPGTGLGLAIVKEIVDIHNGKITVHSEVDRGTRVEVMLPAAGDDSAYSIAWTQPSTTPRGT